MKKFQKPPILFTAGAIPSPWIICAIVVTLTACNLFSPSTASTPSPQVVTPANSPTGSSVVVQTPTSTVTTTSLYTTPIPTVTDTPMITVTLSATGTLATVSTLSPSQLRANVDTNCRSGPGPEYDVLGYLLAGEVAEVVGKNAQGSWWNIQKPNKPGEYCWVWGKAIEFQGSSTGVQVVAAPPTPTSQTTVNFYASFNGLVDCGTNMWAVFNVSNTGAVRFNSVEAEIVDTDNGKTLRALTELEPPFRKKPCGDFLAFLDVQSTALIAVRLSKVNPDHLARASIRLCSGEHISGKCVQRGVKFTLH